MSTKNAKVIKVLIEENPKRPKSRAFVKFGLLMKYHGKKVLDYKQEEGKHPKLDREKGWTTREINWALKQGWIKLARS
jgi:hypothetical protein